MKVTVGYKAVSAIDIPICVTYTCSKCNGKNIDVTQKIHVEGVENGSLWDKYEKLRAGSNRALQDNVKKIFQEAEQKRFRRCGLKCYCSQCGNSEVWSNYVPIISMYRKAFSSALFIGILFLIVMFTVAVIQEPFCFIGFGFEAFLLVFPLIFGLVKNVVIDRQIARMKEENLPHISIQIK